jgi:arylsulfatase A-like enzyme
MRKDADGDGKNDGVVKHVGYTTDVITDLALDWMRDKRDKEKPFMLMFQHKAPHRNWQPAPKYLNKYDDVTLPEPPTLFDDYSGRTLAAHQQDMTIAETMTRGDLKLSAPGNLTPEQKKLWDAAYDPKNEALAKAKLTGKELVRWKYQRYVKDYLRCIASVDDGIGRMLAYLKEAGLAENTIVIYCSDQGFYLGEHGWFDKRWMYEESLRTPMLVRWPKVVKPGSRNNDIVSPIDFAETFCEIAGIEVPGDMHGRSLVSVLKGKTPPDWRKSFYYHYYEYPGWHYVRRHYGVADGRYKLIHFYEKDVDQWELFDLKSDPGEMKSVFGKPGMAKVQKWLSKQLAMHRKELEVPEEDPPHSIVKRLPPRLRKPTTPN